MRKKGDFSRFKHGITVLVQWAGLSISKISLLNCSHITKNLRLQFPKWAKEDGFVAFSRMFSTNKCL